MKVDSATKKIETQPIPVEPPDRFEGPRHREVVMALAQEALHRVYTDDEARTDHLTRLQNRRSFDEALAESLANQDADNPVAVMIIDLDKFKIINDTIGHREGDRTLIHTADILARVLNVRKGEQAFRWGGDEFALLVYPKNDKSEFVRDEALSPSEIMDGLSKRIIDDVNLISSVIGVPEFGASVGYALFQPGDTAESISKRADQAMYASKTSKLGDTAV